jgi:hypothetical protein
MLDRLLRHLVIISAVAAVGLQSVSALEPPTREQLERYRQDWPQPTPSAITASHPT